MNKYITILKYKGLYSHQTLIKNNLLMKRENRKQVKQTIRYKANDDFLFW